MDFGYCIKGEVCFDTEKRMCCVEHFPCSIYKHINLESLQNCQKEKELKI